MRRLILLLAVLLVPSQAFAAIAHVQSRQNTNTVGTSVTLAYTSDITPGTTKVVVVMSGSTTAPTNVDDPQGAYTKDLEQDQTTDGITLSFWHLCNATSGATTVTVTNGSSQSTRIVILEYSGYTSACEKDQSNSAQADSVGVDVPTDTGDITTTQADEVLVGALIISTTSASVTQPASFTVRQDLAAGNVRLSVADRIVSSTGTYNYAPSQKASGAHLAVGLVSYKDTGGGGSPATNFFRARIQP